MPVSQVDTATTVASTGTYDVARFGIEGRSVRDGATRCQPPLSANPESASADSGCESQRRSPRRRTRIGRGLVSDRRRNGEARLISSVGRTTVPDSMPRAFANAEPVRTPIISFAIFAAYKRS